MSKQAVLIVALAVLACGLCLGYYLGLRSNKNEASVVTPIVASSEGRVPPGQPVELPPEHVLLYFHTWDAGETKTCYTRPDTRGNVWCDILLPKISALNARMFSVKFSRPPWPKTSRSTAEELWDCTKDEHSVFTCTSLKTPK